MELTINTELIKRFSDLDLGFEVEVGIGELLAFTEGALCTVFVSAIVNLGAVMTILIGNILRARAPIAPAEAADDVPMILKRETFERKSPTGL